MASATACECVHKAVKEWSEWVNKWVTGRSASASASVKWMQWIMYELLCTYTTRASEMERDLHMYTGNNYSNKQLGYTRIYNAHSHTDTLTGTQTIIRIVETFPLSYLVQTHFKYLIIGCCFFFLFLFLCSTIQQPLSLSVIQIICSLAILNALARQTNNSCSLFSRTNVWFNYWLCMVLFNGALKCTFSMAIAL